MDSIARKYFHSISVTLVTFLFSMFVPSQLWALPETAVDFSQTASTLVIDTMSTSTPNVLRNAAMTCPENGFVVAIANGGLQYSVPNDTFVGTMVISISRNSTAVDPNHD